jgi:hypothetical protein
MAAERWTCSQAPPISASCAIRRQQAHRMSARDDGLGDFHEMHIHHCRIAEGQDEARRLALFWADRAKEPLRVFNRRAKL